MDDYATIVNQLDKDRYGRPADVKTAEEKKQQKAKALRYKKPILQNMNLDFIQEEIWEMEENIYDVQWFIDDNENLTAALDGDEDEAWEFKAAFSDLAAQLERFKEDLNNEWIPECFDELFPATGADCFGAWLGWDSYEQDYFGLGPYVYTRERAQEEAEKRICRMTKKELLEAVGACLKVYTSYMALRYRYDCLKASLDIIREKNLERLKLIKAIEEQYIKAEEESNHFEFGYGQEVRKLDQMLDQVPQEYWIQ